MVQILAGAKEFSLFQDVKTGFGTHPASYLMGTEIFPGGGVEWLGQEVDHLFSSSVNKKERSFALHINCSEPDVYAQCSLHKTQDLNG
jgi:hypothetical protein